MYRRILISVLGHIWFSQNILVHIYIFHEEGNSNMKTMWLQGKLFYVSRSFILFSIFLGQTADWAGRNDLRHPGHVQEAGQEGRQGGSRLRRAIRLRSRLL